MEKRFFLAIFVSFIILYGWSTFIKPKSSLEPQANIKMSDNKEDIRVPTTLDASLPSKIEKIIPQEQIQTLQSKKVTVDFIVAKGLINKILINEYDYSLPIKNYFDINLGDNVVYQISNQSDNEIEFTFENDEYIEKRIYKLVKDDYTIQVDNIFINKTGQIISKDIIITGFTIDTSSLDISSKNADNARDKGLFEYVINVQKEIVRKNKAYSFSEKDLRSANKELHWIGFRDRYFCTIIKPLFEIKGYNTEVIDSNILKINFNKIAMLLPPKGQVSFSSIIFAGPEKINLLKTYNAQFEDIQKFYKFPLFDGIAKLMYNLLHLFYKIIPIWGVCIILIGTLVYFSMYPLTMRSMLSMKRMQSLQPKMAKLKEQYKNDPQKMNQAVMALYKENNVNPLGGCLPMLLQMPVFIGLYQVLWRSVSFKGAHFLWMKDLSEPDRLFILPTSLPLIGNEINLLPILMMIIMYFQQKISAKNMSTGDPDQAAQQKMMGRIFPLFLGFIFYKFASGLTLYFTMFYIFSTFTQWKMSKVEV